VVAVVHQFGVDLVGQHRQVVVAGERGDPPELVVGHPCAGRVVRVTVQQVVGGLGTRRGQRLACQCEPVFGARGDGTHLAAGELHRRDVRDVRRLGDRDRVAGVNQRPTRQVDPFAGAGGDEHLLVGIVTHRAALPAVGGDRFTEVSPAAVRGVGRAAALQRADRRLAGGPRRGAVRLPDTE